VFAGNTVVTAPQLIVNGIISPGLGGVGALTNNGAATLGAGGRCAWAIQDAVGGPATAWSYLQVSGGLDIQATSDNPFVIQVQSLEDPLQGLPDFDNTTAYNWVFASASGGVTGFGQSKFSVEDDQFADDLAGGYFFVTTNASSLALVFTNNHPPVASDAGYYCSPGTVLPIPIAALASHWSDPDGDPVQLAGVNSSSANGTNNVGFDGTYLYYTNVTPGADTLTYIISDVRTNPPVVYRPGDTVQTGAGLVQVVPPPALNVTTLSGNLMLSGANGLPGSSYLVLFSTNLALPFSAWTRVATNQCDSLGGFAFTNSLSSNLPQQFYVLQLQ
jgi:hypothetical protein